MIPCLQAVGELGARVHPTAGANDNDILRIEPGIDGSCDWATMAERFAAYVDRRVKMRIHKNESAGRHGLCECSYARDGDRVVAAKRHGDGAGCENLRNHRLATGHGYRRVAHHDGHIAHISKGKVGAQIHAGVGIVEEELIASLPQCLGSKICTCAADAHRIPRKPDESSIYACFPQGLAFWRHVGLAHKSSENARVEESAPHRGVRCGILGQGLTPYDVGYCP